MTRREWAREEQMRTVDKFGVFVDVPKLIAKERAHARRVVRQTSR